MDELAQCFQTLRETRGFLQSPGPKVAALQRIGELGQSKHVPYIFAFLFERNGAISRAAAEAIAGLMKKVHPKDFASMYPSVRSINLRVADLAHLDRHPAELAVYLLGVASLNGNGFVRLAALQRLGAIRLPEAVPYVFLRLADWVPQVRVLAAQLVDVAIDRGLTGPIRDCIYLVKWMERVNRIDLQAIRVALLNSLTIKNPQAIREGIDNDEPEVRLFCYSILLSQDDFPRELIDRALHDAFIRVRLWILQFLAQKPSFIKTEWLAGLLADEAPAVRLGAVHCVMGANRTDLDSLITPLLADEAAGVRHAVRFHLGRDHPTDFAPVYRNMLAEAQGQAARPGAVAGLSETGNASDFATVAAYLADSRARVRIAGLTGIARLGARRAMPMLAGMLNDASARVRRHAIAALVRIFTPDTRELLVPILDRADSEAASAALEILVERGSWIGLRDVFWVLVAKPGRMRDAAWVQLEKWVGTNGNSLYTTPSGDLARELAELLDRAQRVSGEHMAKHPQIWSQAAHMVAIAQARIL